MEVTEIFRLNFKDLYSRYKERGGTQSSLARAAGTTQSQISLWLRGTLPSAEHLPGLADALDVSIDTLFRRQVAHAEQSPALSPSKRRIIAALTALDEDQPGAATLLATLEKMLLAHTASQGAPLDASQDQHKPRK